MRHLIPHLLKPKTPVNLPGFVTIENETRLTRNQIMKRFCMLTGIVLTCSTAGMTQDGKETDGLFKKLDKNSDGKLVADEIPKKETRFFERLVRLGDADKDGELTQSEFSKATADTSDVPSARGGDGVGRRPGNSGGRQIDATAFFKRLDQNGDGKIARDELPEQLAQRFAPAFDKIGKDAITLEEFQRLRQQMGQGNARQPNGRTVQTGNPAEMFKRLDTNGDGKLTPHEVPEQKRRMVTVILERSGKGRDNSLTQQEFQNLVEQFNPQQNGRPASDGNAKRLDSNRPKQTGNAMRRPGQGDRLSNGGPAFLRILDANKDGRLSRDELAKAVTLIDRLDQNRDGSLDGRELLGPPPGNGQGSVDRPRQNSDMKASDRPRRPRSEYPDKDKPREQTGLKSDQSDRERSLTNVNLEETFSRMDRDKDGAISKEESPDRLKRNFDRVDANKDGKVSLEELRAISERSRKQ